MDIIQEEEKEEKKQQPEEESEKVIDGKAKKDDKINNEEEIKIIRKTIPFSTKNNRSDKRDLPFRDLKLKIKNDINKRYTRKLSSAGSSPRLPKKELTLMEEIALFITEMKNAMAELDQYFEETQIYEPKKIEQIQRISKTNHRLIKKIEWLV